MGADILLGRIAGVDVAASWSLLVILGLITWTPGAGVLPVAAPGTSAAAVWATAAVTAVAFFASWWPTSSATPLWPGWRACG
jgi:hypothetical protein